MIGANIFYKSSDMAPTTRIRPKREGSPALPATSVTKSKKAKSAASLKVETPDSKAGQVTQGIRRSPRITKNAKVSLSKVKVDVLKENVKTRGKKMVKKEMSEEEDVEEGIERLKEEQDSDLSDVEEPTPGLSEYERRRMENISKNAEFFASLDIFKAKENLVALSPQGQVQKAKTPTRGLKSQKRSDVVPLQRRPPSLRLQNKSPEGAALPEKFREPPLSMLYLQETRRPERLSSDPVPMEATNVKKEDKTDAGADFVKGLAALACGKKASVKADDAGLDKLMEQLQKMKMKERYIAKVVPDRIFSVAVHPSVEKTIAAAGDKWGKIGMWDVNSTKGDDGVFLFAPHTRPVNCLRFSPSDSTKLYSVAYDGTVRCGDFNKAVFDEVYSADDDEVIWTSYLDFMSADGHSLLVTQNDRTGSIAVVDTRTRKRGENLYFVHPRNTKTVSVHPTEPHYFVTASNDTTAALWDIRSMKTKGPNKPIATMPHGKSVNSAFFSPITGAKILTTSIDDKISIFDTESAKDGKLTGVQRTLWQRHDNYTGRWLTVFRASWLPRREDAFVVGSMSRPRRIEVFSSKGKIVHNFFNENYLGSVCSINVFHPTRDILVGGNSSGKLHVFMT